MQAWQLLRWGPRQNDQKAHAEAYERTLAVLDTMIRAARP